MPLGVAFIAGTAIRGVVGRVVMRGVLERHPEAFLVTLERWGVTIPMADSQLYIAEHIARGLEERGLPPGSPVVLVGHSQGGLAGLRYALDHKDQVPHVVTVGTPWRGAQLAGTLDGLAHIFTRRHVPALHDMRPDSPFLKALHLEMPAMADRVTNIYSRHEVLIQPYVSAHIDIPGTTNVLVATAKEYAEHLKLFGHRYPIDELIEARLNHLEEMSSPAVRSIIWRTVTDLQQTLDAGFDRPETQEHAEQQAAEQAEEQAGG